MSNLSASIWRSAGFKTKELAVGFLNYNDNFSDDVDIVCEKIEDAEKSVQKSIKDLIKKKYSESLSDF